MLIPAYFVPIFIMLHMAALFRRGVLQGFWKSKPDQVRRTTRTRCPANSGEERAPLPGRDRTLLEFFPLSTWLSTNREWTETRQSEQVPELHSARKPSAAGPFHQPMLFGNTPDV